MSRSIDDVAVIILNYNSWQETLEEIKVLHDFFHISAEQIYVVDNNSKNDSAEQLTKASNGNYRIILSKENAGYAAGNNIGLKQALADGYKYGFVLNNDILFNDEETISKLREVFDKDSSVAVISPDVYYPDGKLYNRNSVRPNFWMYTLGIISYKRKCRQVEDLGGYGYVYRPQGCCMMLDLAKVAEVGYMDEHTFLYCEEPILAERLLVKNYSVAVSTTTSIVHNHSMTVKNSIKRKEMEKIHLTSHNYLLREYRHYSKFQIFMVNIFERLIIRLKG